MNIHFVSYSVDNSINCVAAALLQGLCLNKDLNVSTNFSHDVRVASNASIGTPTLSGLSFAQLSFKESDEVLIVDDNTPHGIPSHAPELLSQLVAIRKSRPVVILSHQDASNFVTYPEVFDLVYIAHHTTLFSKNLKYRPLPIGLPFEIIHESEARLSAMTKPKRSGIIHNFGRTLSQGVRQALAFGLVPLLEKHFKVTRSTSRGNDYIQELISHEAILAYGGDFVWELQSSYGHERTSYFSGIQRGDVAVVRWDSWRFWEACAFGCVPITLNFERYGLTLPEPFIPWKHYIPVCFDDPLGSIFTLRKRIAEEPNYFEAVGQSAREFSIKHYGPSQLASRILDAISSVQKPH
jgi:hypothetical protein